MSDAGGASSAARPRTAFAGVPVVAGLTLVSRVLGLLRDAATAAAFGAGPVLDAFTVAFRLPNLARRLLGEGALSAALLPALVKARGANGGANGGAGDDLADALATAVVGRLAVGLGVAVLLGQAVLLPLALGAVGGLGGEWRLLCGLTAACAPLAAFTCVAAQLAAALHARGRFAAAAFCPILLNLLWLAGVAGAALLLKRGAPAGDAIYSVAAAVTVAGAVQTAFLIDMLRRAGFRWRRDPAGVRAPLAAVRAAVVPALIGLSVTQVNALIDGFAAWGLAAPANDPDARLLPGLFGGAPYPLRSGAASALYFGQRLYQFPVGVFGVAVGTVLFPRFAAASRGELNAAALGGLRLVLYIGVPASVGLILTADLLSEVLFNRGAFDAAAARRTAQTAACLGAGAWAGCGLSVVTRVFYAADDRVTPVRAGVWAVGANLLLNATLVWPLGVAGLAAAGAAATCGQFVLLICWLGRAVPGWRPRALAAAAGRAALGGAAAGAACLLMRRLVGSAGWGWPPGGELVAAVLAAVGVFLPLTWALGMREALELLGGRRRSA